MGSVAAADGPTVDKALAAQMPGVLEDGLGGELGFRSMWMGSALAVQAVRRSVERVVIMPICQHSRRGNYHEFVPTTSSVYSGQSHRDVTEERHGL